MSQVKIDHIDDFSKYTPEQIKNYKGFTGGFINEMKKDVERCKFLSEIDLEEFKIFEKYNPPLDELKEFYYFYKKIEEFKFKPDKIEDLYKKFKKYDFFKFVVKNEQKGRDNIYLCGDFFKDDKSENNWEANNYPLIYDEKEGYYYVIFLNRKEKHTTIKFKFREEAQNDVRWEVGDDKILKFESSNFKLEKGENQGGKVVKSYLADNSENPTKICVVEFDRILWS